MLAARVGWSFPPERWPDLQRGLGTAAGELGCEDAEACISRLVSAPLSQTQIDILASHLTVGETYFFREPRSLTALREDVLPELISSRRGHEATLRLWSAGCCTGEEPYSIAILLQRMLPDLRDWNITILATDINRRFLQKAQRGVYSQWSFRNAPPWLKEGYFRPTVEGRFEVVPHIKQLVTFSYLNLAEDVYPSLLNDTEAMDVIFCRNVLMYFTTAQARKVVGSLHRCLQMGGWLVGSPSEASHQLFAEFTPVNFSGATLYRKQAAPVAAPPPSSLSKRPEILVQPPLALPAHPVTPPPASMPEGPSPAAPVSPMVAAGGSAPARPARPPSLQPASAIGGTTATPARPRRSPVPSPPAAFDKTPAAPAETAVYREFQALYGAGRYGEAADKLAAVAVSDVDRARGCALLARAYANQGRLAEARQWCEEALAADKMNKGCHYLRATILQEQGQLQEAVASLKRALYLDHDFVLAHFALGNLMGQHGKSREAQKHFSNALSLLGQYAPEDILPESEDMTAGRLAAIITEQTATGPPAAPPRRRP